MGSSPDRIRSDIEATRAKLTEDVNELAERVSPQRVARRRGEQLRGAASRVRDRLPGGGRGRHRRGD